MLKLILTAYAIISCLNLFSQTVPNNAYQSSFNLAYQHYPTIPRGILEAVSFTQTRFQHLDIFEQTSCAGLPQSLTLMGLIDNGKNYFRENLKTVSRLSNYSTSELLNNPTIAILGYAASYKFLMDSLNISNNINDHTSILIHLSALPIDHNAINNFALNSHLYSIYAFLKNATYQIQYGFENHAIDLEYIFGNQNMTVLSSSHIMLNDSMVYNSNGTGYLPINRSTEYGPALWTPAPSCNYSSRAGIPVSAITIHTIQGSYAGAISWSQNCNSNVSYHYVIRSSDGQVTQMVLEDNKAWHVGSENPYTIGYEHEGYVSNPAWYTNTMLTSSADLSRDVTQSGYGINPLRTYFGASSTGTNLLGNCTKIKGHQHYPNQSHTDPGIHWDWENYYKLINNTPKHI